MKTGKIYKITCSVTNLSYVGQTVQPINIRFNQHCDSKSYCRLLLNDIQKYGRDKFQIQILWEGEIDQLIEMEKKYIKESNTLDPNGYNLRDGGGKHGKVSEQSRQLMLDKQREISLRRNGKLGGIVENKSKKTGEITSWSVKAKLNSKTSIIKCCKTLEEALEVQTEFTKDPYNYEIPPSKRVANGKGKGMYIFYTKNRNKWTLMINNKYIGRYDSKEEAEQKRDELLKNNTPDGI